MILDSTNGMGEGQHSRHGYSKVGLQQYTDASANHDIFSNDTSIDI